MLGYCTLGTNDLQASAAFYDPIALPFPPSADDEG